MTDNEDEIIEVVENETQVLPPGLIAKSDILGLFKGAVLGEYHVDENGDTMFYVLVQVGDSFRWVAAEDAIPTFSSREYRSLTAVD